MMLFATFFASYGKVFVYAILCWYFYVQWRCNDMSSYFVKAELLWGQFGFCIFSPVFRTIVEHDKKMQFTTLLLWWILQVGRLYMIRIMRDHELSNTDDRRKSMKIFSIGLIILSSAGIIAGETLSLVNSSIDSHGIVGISFIGFGVGAILFGLHMLHTK